MRGSASQTVTVAVTYAMPATSAPSSCNAMSASSAWFAARVVTPACAVRTDETLVRHVVAELLQRHVGVERLVRRVGVHQRGRLVGHHLFQNRGDGLALGEPLPPVLGQPPRRVGLVVQDG